MKVMMQEKRVWTAENIRALRKRYGEKQGEFASRFRLTVDAIRNWEYGRKDPSGPATLILDQLLEQINERELQSV